MSEYLFLGGELHGEKIRVPSSSSTFRIPVAPKPEAALFSGAAYLEFTGYARIETYTKRRLGRGYKTKSLFALNVLSNQQVRALLLDHLMSEFFRG